MFDTADDAKINEENEPYEDDALDCFEYLVVNITDSFPVNDHPDPVNGIDQLDDTPTAHVPFSSDNPAQSLYRNLRYASTAHVLAHSVVPRANTSYSFDTFFQPGHRHVLCTCKCLRY